MAFIIGAHLNVHIFLQEKCVEDIICFYVNLQHSVSQNEPWYRHTVHSLVSLDASFC